MGHSEAQGQQQSGLLSQHNPEEATRDSQEGLAGQGGASQLTEVGCGAGKLGNNLP